uniref:TPR1-like CTLH-containing domain-containing protein n=1 Tax=Zea mays TaxID=4577 RepID=A0A804Q997_MAIZE
MYVSCKTKINGKLVSPAFHWLKTLDKVYRNVVPSFHHVSSCSPVQERADALRTKIANQLFEKERADALRTKIANQLFEKAVEIFIKDVKVFASFNGELFKEITKLLTLENFRKRHAAHARGYLQIDVGSMDKHSTKSDEEYEDLAMRDVMATGPTMNSKL